MCWVIKSFRNLRAQCYKIPYPYWTHSRFYYKHFITKMMKPCISNLGENDLNFFFFFLLVSQILYWQNFAYQFAKKSILYLLNLVTIRLVILYYSKFWGTRFCHLGDDLYNSYSVYLKTQNHIYRCLYMTLPLVHRCFSQLVLGDIQIHPRFGHKSVALLKFLCLPAKFLHKRVTLGQR